MRDPVGQATSSLQGSQANQETWTTVWPRLDGSSGAIWFNLHSEHKPLSITSYLSPFELREGCTHHPHAPRLDQAWPTNSTCVLTFPLSALVMGGIFDIFVSKPDVNDSLSSSNRDFGVGVRKLRKGGKALSMEGDCRKKGISLKTTFPFLIIAELITRMAKDFLTLKIFSKSLFHLTLSEWNFPKLQSLKVFKMQCEILTNRLWLESTKVNFFP